jgi:hypothetical protein
MACRGRIGKTAECDPTHVCSGREPKLPHASTYIPHIGGRISR